MKVRELIDALAGMPPDADVYHLWDGDPRTEIVHVWLARNGTAVVTADRGETCYDEAFRPASVPPEPAQWRTPGHGEPPLIEPAVTPKEQGVKT